METEDADVLSRLCVVALFRLCIWFYFWSEADMSCSAPGPLPGLLFASGPFSQYFVSLTSLQHSALIKIIAFQNLVGTSYSQNSASVWQTWAVLPCSSPCKLRWRPFLSISSEVIVSILKILTKTNVQFLTSCLTILFRLSSHHANSTYLEWNLLSLLSPNYPSEKKCDCFDFMPIAASLSTESCLHVVWLLSWFGVSGFPGNAQPEPAYLMLPPNLARAVFSSGWVRFAPILYLDNAYFSFKI